MSQEFKLKFDQIQQNPPVNKVAEERETSKAFAAIYSSESHTRHLCFVWQDGNRIFLNYSYLITGEYIPGSDTIILTFTSHVFVLKGVNLENLFYDIMHGIPKQIVCTHARYNLIGEDEAPLVNEITMTKNAA